MQIPQAQPWLVEFPMWLAGTGGEGEAPDDTAVQIQWKRPGIVPWQPLVAATPLANGMWGVQLTPVDTAIVGEISFRAVAPGCVVWKWTDQVMAPTAGTFASNQLDQMISLLTRLDVAERA